MAYNKIALIGIGNIMFHDEGLGDYLVKYIENNYNIPDNLTLVEGGTLDFSLISNYRDFDQLIVVGASSQEGETGTIYAQSGKEMEMAQYAVDLTAKEFDISFIDEEVDKIRHISMIPENIIEVRNALTESVLRHMPKLLEVTLKELKHFGITLNRTFCRKRSFEKIIDDCANNGKLKQLVFAGVN
ncbi:hydrogenase maturation protease [Sulfurovum sp. XGS-02]|uniref:hydrogenase maturation protease n=1 Tax=Sulfurovum sp. XGS-02 TaxID=2925411 RepID=UPI002058F6F2|nr:hydrogenase maturation protease [Sulfurovum sp. XGS-02]UPT78473.1 hydrogenase maturation protease [Sulfurovum sp. XGS-02]